ncbi:acyl-CoA thioesterase [Pacificimonas sp. WHA3]|uniref:Acyl-CoA thioesterase n=1 Tax=Pacificimonas pallii TaxID=2827236 RepID=A0ABS6SFZ0_9SPHN|nr:thioesterase family protein [Pacificimonas pallii]MBV7257332.1 acyl-CoA thioesterase [Pacificimonas pallii]
MARSEFRFIFPLRVRYAECDVQGVVFNSRYLEYLDVGVTEYWRAVGLWDGGSQDLEFHVVRNIIDYRKPLLMDEEFDICLRTARIGTSSMTMFWELHGRGEEDLRAQGETISVHVAEARGAPAPVPDAVVNMFAAFEGGDLKGKPAR